jgi:hypothetical protein
LLSRSNDDANLGFAATLHRCVTTIRFHTSSASSPPSWCESCRRIDVLANVRIDQPRVSDLRRGRLERISVERLIRWLSQMGYRVEFNLTKVPGHRLVLLD